MVDIHSHMQADKLERYAFLWSLARMVIAAFSLFFGAMPIAYRLLMGSSVMSLLPLFWLISGAASVYLVYIWFKKGQMVFGGKVRNDTIAFLIMIVTGLNLGYTAIGSNIGMNLVWDMPIADLLFKATGIIYLVVAYYLWKRWNASQQNLFGGGVTDNEPASIAAEVQEETPPAPVGSETKPQSEEV